MNEVCHLEKNVDGSMQMASKMLETYIIPKCYLVHYQFH
jgi:hypothetical protein